MQTVEQLRVQQEIEMKQLVRQHEIANLMPVPPKTVQITSSPSMADWVIYDVKGLEEAIALFEQFVIVPFYRRDNLLRPRQYLPKDVEPSGPFSVRLDAEFNADQNYGTSLELAWFTRVNDQVFEIKCRVEGPDYIGRWNALKPQFSRTGSTRRSKVDRFFGCDLLRKHLPCVITWYNGHAPSTWHATHVFTLTHGEGFEQLGEDHTHTLDALRALNAEALKAGGQ